MTPLCFIDTETTGLHPGRVAWEIGMIRRDDEGERTGHCFVDVDLSNADPFALGVGNFYGRHPDYVPGSRRGIMGWRERSVPDEDAIVRPYTENAAAHLVERFTHGAHLVGSVPNFDAETLDDLLRSNQLIPAWHYHLIDVENLAVGWLRAKIALNELLTDGGHGLDMTNRSDHFEMTELMRATQPPWESEELSRLCDVEPASEVERHTALGDARWAMRLYDRIMEGKP